MGHFQRKYANRQSCPGIQGPLEKLMGNLNIQKKTVDHLIPSQKQELDSITNFDFDATKED